MKLLSERHRLYSSVDLSEPDAIEKAIAPSRAMLSESGWVFLVNDGNDFHRFQFGLLGWDPESRTKAAEVIRTRTGELAAAGIDYRKFIVPEKSIVYAEYLPSSLPDSRSIRRPALMLAEDCPECVDYLGDYLIDARSLGQLYFRGDTHTNWFGAWLVYLRVIESLNAAELLQTPPIPLRHLVAELAGWEGDLWVQVAPELLKEYEVHWGLTLPDYGFDTAVSYHLKDEMRRATRVAVPDDYKAWFKSRETIAYERSDGEGPRAVIFRDSTLDMCHDLIAQHFSRSVFIWHQGLVIEDVIERERPDIVLHIMAERFVSRYPNSPPSVRVSPES